VLDEVRLGEPVSLYLTEDVLHQISTLTNGKRVWPSNHNGARYGIVLARPNPLPAIVPFPQELPGNNIFPIGVTSGRAEISLPVQRLHNMLVGGSPESGKSNLLEGLALTALQYGYQLYLADPEEHTFAPDAWNGLTSKPVASSLSAFGELLETIKAELERRQALFHQAAQNGIPPKDLDAYNATAKERLPRLMLVVDEANSYLDKSGVADAIFELARRGRKWGAHLVLAGHNWRAADVPRALSSMFSTRLCFKVDDDTSGGVVLGSREYGMRAMSIRRKGRAILRQSGGYYTVQTYLVSEELKQDWRKDIQPPSPLSELEKRLVAYAIEQLEGKFKVNQLAQAFSGEGVSNHQVQKLAERFEARGWLTHPRHATDARRVTDELRHLAGFPQIGE
jgi:DNA segregation ATPase FtsK/SpoIIIE-like protein